jgi:LPXTG-motif cell wall-anchored protein
MRKLIITGGVAAALALGGGVAVADDTPDCPDVAKRVDVSGTDDPWSLDHDGDGFGCETYAKNGTVKMADLLKPPAEEEDGSVEEPAEKPAELAETGWGPGDHPVRWSAFAGGLLVAGTGAIVLSRRKEARA